MNDPQYQFEKEWDEDTSIGWWKQNRIQLNRIIRAYNDWQINGFDASEEKRVRALIEYGMQTLSEDGDYIEVAQRMKEFVEKRVEPGQV